MARASLASRALLREIYLQDLVLSIYRVYAERIDDPEGRAILETYLRGEAYRGRRIADLLAAGGVTAPAAVRALFSAVGRLYGRATSWLGTRIMVRIIMSASQRAARRACAAVGAAAPPEAQYLATLKARNEGDLADSLRQRLIDTRPRKN